MTLDEKMMYKEKAKETNSNHLKCEQDKIENIDARNYRLKRYKVTKVRSAFNLYLREKLETNKANMLKGKANK